MAMSDCVKCWSTPCTCGWDYRFDSKDDRLKLASAILGIDYKLLKDLLGNHVPDSHPLKGGR